AQQIVKSLNTTQNVREDMLLILSSFDNRLSNITDLVQANESSFKTRLEEAEKILFMYESGVDFEIDEVSEYFSALDDVLNLL
ncbi:hypothetical protein, partial [Streptomyces fildesensis]|uniref:hypothetical protein n=1 Tax=Streptomyces fildesensis TaxID=375757 RepID=UPI0018DF1361